MTFYFDSFDEFVAMGGHGFYVWLAYAFAVFALIFYYVYSNKQNNVKRIELAKFYRQIESRNSPDPLNTNSRDK